MDQNEGGIIDERDLNVPDTETLMRIRHLAQANIFAECPLPTAGKARQLVFWAVDWQSYVDFESAPSPNNSSRYPIPAPPPSHDNPHGDPMDMKIFLTNTDYRRQLNGFYQCLANGIRNPELVSLFPPSGAGTAPLMISVRTTPPTGTRIIITQILVGFKMTCRSCLNLMWVDRVFFGE